MDCDHCRARTKRHNLDGHLNCRRHAPCNENKSGWWSRQNCQVCENLWEQCITGPEDVSSVAKSSLRLWIRGYQKNLAGHYVREEQVKEFLFPAGLLPRGPPPRTSTPVQEVEEIMDTEEGDSLSNPSFFNKEPALSQAEEEELLTFPLPIPGQFPPPSTPQGTSSASMEPGTPFSGTETPGASNLGVSRDLLTDLMVQICNE